MTGEIVGHTRNVPTFRFSSQPTGRKTTLGPDLGQTFDLRSTHFVSLRVIPLPYGRRRLLFPRAQNFPVVISPPYGGVGRESSFSLFGPPFDVGEWWHGVSHNLFFCAELLHLGSDHHFAHGRGELPLKM